MGGGHGTPPGTRVGRESETRWADSSGHSPARQTAVAAARAPQSAAPGPWRRRTGWRGPILEESRKSRALQVSTRRRVKGRREGRKERGSGVDTTTHSLAAGTEAGLPTDSGSSRARALPCTGRTSRSSQPPLPRRPRHETPRPQAAAPLGPCVLYTQLEASGPSACPHRQTSMKGAHTPVRGGGGTSARGGS